MNHSGFKAAWWLQSPHLQTLWATSCRRRPIKNLTITRERYELPDGDFIDLDWVGKNKGPIVIISGSLPWCAEYWLEKRAPQFLQKYLAEV